MRVHALETGVAVIRERQLRRVERLAALRTALSRTPWTEIPVRAWLIEHPAGLILVDTGWTARVNEPGYLPRENLYMRRALRPRITPEEELGPRLRELGFAPGDIRWTVLTHMHLDHEGGLAHVKDSEIVVSETEYALARGLAGRLRGYLPHRWPDGFAPRVVNPPAEGLELADGVVLLATPGHTAGHMSVLVEGEPRILLAGDAAYNEDLLDRGIPDSLATDPPAARQTMARIRALQAERETIVLPTHDPDAAARLARHRDQNRRFRPGVAQDTQRDAVEPDQVAASEAARRPGDAA